MSEGTSNQPRFCTNCGNQIRSETQFCVSCGASLAPNQEPTESRSIPSGPSPSERLGSVADSLKESIQRLKARFSAASSSPSGNTWRGTPSRLVSWFRDIPIGAKFALAGFLGILGLIILALASPVVRVVAIIVFGVSILAMVVRGVQRRSIREWGVIAVASLVLIPIFGGVSGIVYNADSQSGNEVAGNLENDVGGDNSDPEDIPTNLNITTNPDPATEADRPYVLTPDHILTYSIGGTGTWFWNFENVDYEVAENPRPEELALCLQKTYGFLDTVVMQPTCVEMVDIYESGGFPPNVEFDEETGDLYVY